MPNLWPTLVEIPKFPLMKLTKASLSKRYFIYKNRGKLPFSDPFSIRMHPVSLPSDHQVEKKKEARLLEILKEHHAAKTLIFVNTKKGWADAKFEFCNFTRDRTF